MGPDNYGRLFYLPAQNLSNGGAPLKIEEFKGFAEAAAELGLTDTTRPAVSFKQSLSVLGMGQDAKGEVYRYLKNPVKSTILVFAWKHGTPDGRKSFTKEVKKTVYFESKPLYPNQVAAWIKAWMTKRKCKIEEQACELLVESLGNDLSKVANELEKLTLDKEPGAAVTVDDIEKKVGISKEFNPFELNNALGAADKTKVFQIVNYFSANPKSGPIIMILGTLQGFFSKVYLVHQCRGMMDKDLASAIKVSPYFVKDYKLAAKNYSEQKLEQIFYTLEEYDLRAKGVNSTNNIKEGELLKELVVKILNR
jgi:DNA polymerase-3 subunit delta